MKTRVSVVQGSRVQRRAQSSNWIEDERETCDCQDTDEYKTGGKA